MFLQSPTAWRWYSRIFWHTYIRILKRMETIFSCWRKSHPFIQIRYIWEEFTETALE